jgi:hypothetical protein
MMTMHRRSWPAWVPAFALAFACVTAPPAVSAAGVPYQLDAASEQQIGCLHQCACPVLMRGPVQGGFTLTPAGRDGAFDVYTVTGVQWSVKDHEGIIHTAVGAGTYRRGGAEQRMELDLSLDGTPPLRFDSELVPVTTPWPAVDVDVFRHLWCFDTLYTVSAAPASATVGPPGVTRLAAPRPSPFRDRVELAFSLASESTVELSIHDLAGRRVRTLLTGARLGPGPHTVQWDGHADDGRRVPAGVLFARFSTGRHTDRRLLVRVD